MKKTFELLQSLCDIFALSGCEPSYTKKEIPILFSELGAKADRCGNLWVVQKSNLPGAKNILIEAHLDQIGLCVSEILDGGFLSVCSSGGFDANILPGTEFYVHGQKKYKAVATSVPPHLKQKTDPSKLSLDQIYLDCGFRSKEEAEQSVFCGASVSFAAAFQPVRGDLVCAPALDNKAAVASLILTLQNVRSPHNLYFLFTVGEETTSRGVKSAAFEIKPDFALVVDAGFAQTKGLDSDRCIRMHYGPSVSIADTLSLKLAKWVIRCAGQNEIALQTVVEPGGTGTSATALQMRLGGIPCALISIPLKYMHTPSEIVSIKDIDSTAKLLCTLLEQDHLEEVFPLER